MSEVYVHVCGNGWGLGTYTYIDDDGKEQMGYGFPWHGMNPHDFFPDYEMCSEKEIESWKAASAATVPRGKA